MVARNPTFTKLKASYLFREINDRKLEYVKKNPKVKIISLGIGDTVHPLPPTISNAIQKQGACMGTVEGYSGYPPFNGSEHLRELISQHFYKGIVNKDEIYVSDGSKPDLARFLFMMNKNATVAVQNPVYPAYVDGVVINGVSGEMNENGQYSNITYMPCNPKNDFFPDLTQLARTDFIYFCSPNNPTGAAATRTQLEELVKFAKKNKSIIIFDAAYSEYVTSKDVPRSIFEIEGARECAFETNSFSKSMGFTGVRLGWTVCPKQMKFEDGSLVCDDWARVASTLFNGPSILAERAAIGGLLTEEGRKEVKEVVDYYRDNAAKIKDTLEKAGFKVYGAVDSPYIWMEVEGDSWDTFQLLLDNTGVITTPGAGFGSEGGRFIRISSFANRDNVKEALERIIKHFSK